ncbi:phycobiliprotein lyase [Prochlorothrix hollandica]|uniref:Chromophore lyase CpcS/CpeS n=1 Tax=Prochlorothrix hollandica PCC 9006 = CALU 1027 TaxID=317619 RepID=A0A0M2Q2R0_PROHO|nr:phycobiliprotein lyase [Prochlorothrix hollandica]KKJ01548.1 hypothetical protein PROH_04420 [Prochlorothrix hollandica PCC 9006 = CALU 1027]
MILASAPVLHSPLEQETTQFFRDCVGRWHSKRRYHTLKSGLTQDVICTMEIEFLEAQSSDLLHLAHRHNLRPDQAFVAGVRISWESQYVDDVSGSPQATPSPQSDPSPPSVDASASLQKGHGKTSGGSSIFGVRGNFLYRDRGFATPDPVVSGYSLSDRTLLIATAYDGSSFSEECKLIGSHYRTRQTIISRNNTEQVIGQYVETRLTATLNQL